MREIRTLNQLKTAWNELREEILSRPLFLDNSEKAKKERGAQCANSVLAFARVYFPDYVPSEFAKFHREWEKICAIETEPVLIEALRGFGKSTFFTLLDPVHQIVYGRCSFMIFSSYNEEKRALFTGRILLELLYNRRLINDFGVFFPDGKKPAVERFTVNVPGSGGKSVGVRVISMGQDPRGFVHGPTGPIMCGLTTYRTASGRGAGSSCGSPLSGLCST